jgi:hypothetical protein
MDKSGAGAGFLRELRFPLLIYIPSASPQSSSLSPKAGTIGQEWPQCHSANSLTNELKKNILDRNSNHFRVTLIPLVITFLTLHLIQNPAAREAVIIAQLKVSKVICVPVPSIMKIPLRVIC